jgi:hypothetical protein
MLRRTSRSYLNANVYHGSISPDKIDERPEQIGACQTHHANRIERYLTTDFVTHTFLLRVHFFDRAVFFMISLISQEMRERAKKRHFFRLCFEARL